MKKFLLFVLILLLISESSAEGNRGELRKKILEIFQLNMKQIERAGDTTTTKTATSATTKTTSAWSTLKNKSTRNCKRATTATASSTKRDEFSSQLCLEIFGKDQIEAYKRGFLNELDCSLEKPNGNGWVCEFCKLRKVNFSRIAIC